MTELSPRERRQQRTHQAILDAARQIISKKGTNALSMRAIAKQIDYSPAGLYEYFGSKEEIIAAVCAQGFDRFANHLNLVDTQLPADEYMVELGMAYVDFAVKNPDFFMLMFSTAPTEALDFESADTLTQTDQNNSQSSFGILLRAVKRSVDEGILQPPQGMDLLELAYAAWAQVHGIAMMRVGGMASYLSIDYARIDRLAIEALYRGYGHLSES